jgi:hypothetical protein
MEDTILEGRSKSGKLIDLHFTESEKYICRQIIELYDEDDIDEVTVISNPRNYHFESIQHIIK